MTSSAVSIVNHKGVRVITMDQPDTRNALTPDLRDALLGSMEDAVADADCQSAGIRSSGDTTAVEHVAPAGSSGRRRA